MSSAADVIAVSSASEQPVYPQAKSRWFGKVQGRPLRLVLSFYSPDGNEIAMPLASISAYLKRDFPEVEVLLRPILIERDAEQYSAENYARDIESLQPDLIAFSVMSPHWFSMESYFAELKARMPELPICVGGYQAMLSQQETIENPHVDFVCTGDGEFAMGNLVQFLRGTKDGPVHGMWEKLADGEVFRTEGHQNTDLSLLPFPDYELFAKEDGFVNVNTSIFAPEDLVVLPVMTGRGCPYRCTYCCNTPLLEGTKRKKDFLRKYDPQEMVDELERLRDRYNVGYFEFWDELFLSNMKFVREFLPIYRDRIGLPFSINSRVEVMNDSFCAMAAEAGCHTIWFGIESGDETYRSEMLGRKMTNQQVIDAAEACKRHGINRLTFNMVGMPGESAENMRKTLELNRYISPEFFFFFPYIPLRGTPLYNTAHEMGLLIENKKDLHYLSAANDRRFVMNMREQPELMTQEQYEEICLEMLAFQESNNRLSLAEAGREQDSRAVTVDDKSVALVSKEEKAGLAEQPVEGAMVAEASNRKGSLFRGIRNIFRSP